MRYDVFSRIARHGQTVTVQSADGSLTRQGKGFIQPAETLEQNKWRRLTPAGRARDSLYLLIAAPELIQEGDEELIVVCTGREYALLRAEPMYLADTLTHWEGVLRLKGGA